MVVWILVIIVVIAIGYALWWMAKKAREADDDLRAMNQGRTNGAGIFGIFRKDRR